MNSTIGQAADLERARVRARDDLFDWARGKPRFKGATLNIIYANGPLELANAYRDACIALGPPWYTEGCVRTAIAGDRL